MASYDIIDLDLDDNRTFMLQNGLELVKTTLQATVNHTSRTRRDKCSRLLVEAVAMHFEVVVVLRTNFGLFEVFVNFRTNF
jgi:hypothetical protein